MTTDAAGALVLAAARIPGREQPVDVHLAGGRVAAITPAGTAPAYASGVGTAAGASSARRIVSRSVRSSG